MIVPTPALAVEGRRQRPRRCLAATWMSVALVVAVGAASGCGPEPDSTDPATGPPRPSVEASPTSARTTGNAAAAAPPATPASIAAGEPHGRHLGPNDDGREVALRVGDRIDVTPPARVGGWVVTEYTNTVLRLDGSPAAAAAHTLTAMAVGQGQLRLVPAGPEARSTGVYTVRVRVLRDVVVPPAQ